MNAPKPDLQDLARLLLVDDDRALCEVMGRAFAARGFDVVAAHSVEDAIRAIDGGEDGCGSGRGRGEIPAHAHRLRALAGEDEGDR